jgi:ribosomal protein S16
MARAKRCSAAGAAIAPFGVVRPGSLVKRLRFRLTRSQWVAVGVAVSATVNELLAHTTRYHLTPDEVMVLALISVNCRSLLRNNSGVSESEA